MATSSPVTIVGNLTRDPEVRTIGNGSTKAAFSVAVNHSYKDKNDEWVENTSFFNVIAWRQLAEAAQVLEKGVRVVVTGRLDQRSWEADDGGQRSTVEVVADDIAVSVKNITGFTRRQRPDSGGERPRPGGKPATAPQYDEEPF